MKSKITSYIDFITKLKYEKYFNKIHAVEVFQRIIEKERERSDRTGLPVSLIIFEENGRDNDYRLLIELIRHLISRVRATDEVGWYDRARVGVILPHTDLLNAERFISNLKELIPNGPYLSDYKLYTYPSSSLFGNDDKIDDSDGVSDEKKEENNNLSFNKASFFEIFQRNSRYSFGKRLFDITLSCAALIFLLPLFVLIAILIKIDSPGPVFFRQERVGYLGRKFTLIKFRTMHPDSEDTSHERYMDKLIMGGMHTAKLDEEDDERIFPFGKILRKTCLDELPQLFNILKGEMSIVGPRPCLPYEVEKYLMWQTKRFDAMPGLTGLWQISGKNVTTYKEMIRYDIAYTRQCSMLVDMKIVLKTVPTIIKDMRMTVS